MTPAEQRAAAAACIVGHIAPATAVRLTPPTLCPYCLAHPAMPCALHRPVSA